MTGEVVGWAFRQKTGSPITKAVLAKLADNANDTGYCFPSIPYLIAHLELSERALREHLKKLEDLGLITVIRRSEGGVSLPNRYQLNVELKFEEVTVVRRGIAPNAAPLSGVVQDGGAPDAKGVVRQVQTETPSLNPQEKPHLETPNAGIVIHAPSDIDLAIEAFNSGAELTGTGENSSGWAKAKAKQPDGRRKAIAARLKEVGLAGWRAAVMRATASDFLAGRSKRSGEHASWRVDLEWFSSSSAFTKVIEGKYDNGGGGRGPGGSTTMDTAFRGISEAFNRNH